jgi:hypothetical protein
MSTSSVGNVDLQRRYAADASICSGRAGAGLHSGHGEPTVAAGVLSQMLALVPDDGELDRRKSRNPDCAGTGRGQVYYPPPHEGTSVCDTTNSRAMHTFRHLVTDLWRRSLQRRSQRHRMTWDRIRKLTDDFLPPARDARFAVKHPRWEPSALIGHARICAGGAQ